MATFTNTCAYIHKIGNKYQRQEMGEEHVEVTTLLAPIDNWQIMKLLFHSRAYVGNQRGSKKANDVKY